MKFFENLHFVNKLEMEACADCSSLLDLGCGKKSPIANFSNKIKYSFGVEAFSAYLEESKKNNIHNDYLLSDIFEACHSFRTNEFDCVIALDIIEHLSKENGNKLIAEMERIARKKTIIFTPNGFLPQSRFDDNDGQEHLSGWDAAEMKNKGYQVYGMSGIRYFRKEKGEIKWRPVFFWKKVSSLSQLIACHYPRLSFQILCVKKLDKKS